MKRFFHILIFMFLGLFCLTNQAQERPPVVNFSPSDYHGETQNWMISQDANKFIYVANNNGLLEFNGATWKRYPSPNNTILRSVRVIGNKVYTGCYMDFGFWKRNDYGNLKYTSLKPFLKKDMIEDEQFWNIIPYGKWVLFQSLNRIYLFNSQTNNFKVVTGDTNIDKIFSINDNIYFFEGHTGLFKLQNGNSKLIVPIAKINNDFVVKIIQFNNKLTLITRHNGFYSFDENGNVKQVLNYNFDKNINLYSAIQLADQSFILGTISNGIYHLNKGGKTLLHLNQDSGLSNNTILSLFEDIDGNVWEGLNNGINCINLKYPIKIYKDNKGELGVVYASKIYKDKLYLGTNQGVFYKDLNNKKARFKFISGTNGQVWSLEVYDDSLFCGHNEGTFIIANNKAKLISKVMGTWQIKPIKNHPNLLIQGNYSGLSILEKKQGKWQFRNKIKGFYNSSRYFEFASDSVIYVNHEYKGVYKLTLDSKNYSSFKKVVKYSRFANAKNSSLVKFRGKVYYASANGIFRLNTSNSKFVKDSAYSKLLTTDSYLSGKLIVDGNQRLWTFSKNNLNYLTFNQLDDNSGSIKRIPIPANLRKTMVGFENLLRVSKNVYLIGIADGYLKLNISNLKTTDYKVFIILKEICIKIIMAIK